MLRDYQKDILNKLTASNSNDLVQLDTGGGKTLIMASLAKICNNFIIIAHRNILIWQISKTLASVGINHNIIATKYTLQKCAIYNKKHFGKTFIDQLLNNRFCASIDSIISRHKHRKLRLDTSFNYLIIIDEAHHCIDENKWGKLRSIFPNSRIVGFTATPCRLDGKSLKSVFNNLVQAEKLIYNSVKTLIEQNFLSDFEVYTIPSNFDFKALKLGINNEYTQQSLDAAICKSTIVGDVIKHYKKLANGKQAVIMCVSILNAEVMANKFLEEGIAAACISSNMSQVEISRRLDLFLAKEIKVLCNVDMVGEGFDVPGIECLIMARKTNSLVSYRQWIGRSLRPCEGKEYAIILDHVANVFRHDMPDSHIDWSLDQPPESARTTNLVACEKCHFTFYGWMIICPHCGFENDLRRGAALGDFYVNQSVVNINLCLAKRDEIDKKIKEENHKKRLETEIIFPKSEFAKTTIGMACEKLRNLFIEINLNYYSFKEINDFLAHRETQCETFWINHFSVNDIKSPNPNKFRRVFIKWERSR